MTVLILKQPDEEHEIEFELEYQSKLTTEQRIKILEEKRKFFQQQLLLNDHRKAFEIIKRPKS